MNAKMILLIQLLLIAQGCVMVKIGGVKSTEAKEMSRRPLEEVCINSFSSIMPQLSTDGRLTLWVSGGFQRQTAVTQKLIEYGDEWMAIGLFPGYDSLKNGYGSEKGETFGNGAIIGLPLGIVLMNGIFVGIPTLCSCLNFLTSEPGRMHTFYMSQLGLIGTCKYEGAKYQLTPRMETVNKGEYSVAPVKLKGFELIVDGIKMSDQDGVVNIGRMLKSGDKIRFRITSAPESPKSIQRILDSMLNIDFVAICK